ncbi:MAG: EthD family reductase [Alphaproteobacteria bacterium]|nr:EthD family reductase [Alphaproteobacteria bacterium]
MAAVAANAGVAAKEASPGVACGAVGSAPKIKTITFLARKPGMSPEAFKRHYETVHVPGALKRIPALARADYRRNYIGDPLRPAPSPMGFDVVTEMTFANEAEYAAERKAVADPAVSKWIADDLATFVDTAKIRTYVVEECVSR